MPARRWASCCASSPTAIACNWRRRRGRTWSTSCGTAGCWLASRPGCSSTSTRCCARSTDTPSRAPATGTPRSPGSRCCARARVRFSVVLTKDPAVSRAIASIPDDAWAPVHYPGAVVDPDTGELISDAEVAEVTFTAFASTKHPVTARLIVRRVRDRASLDELFAVWRYHPFFTNNDEPTVDADITHRQHAIIEAVFADLIDGPLAHLPSGRFAANSAWAICAAMCHNLLRAAGTLAGDRHALARGATLRRHLVTVPARLTRPQRRRVLHLPAHWPWASQWTALWHATFSTGPPAAA